MKLLYRLLRKKEKKNSKKQIRQIRQALNLRNPVDRQILKLAKQGEIKVGIVDS